MNRMRLAVVNLLGAIRIAFGLLTILPVYPRREADTGESTSAWAVAFFPMAGLALGVALYGLATVIADWPPASVATLLVVALVVLTGGLHLDGLSDTVDAFAAGHRQGAGTAKILAVMKDPHVGFFGAVAVGVVLLAKIALLRAIPAAQLPEAVLVLPILGRFPFLVFIPFLDYARSAGTATPFARARWPQFAVAGTTTAAAALLAGTAGLVAFAAVVFWSLLLALYFTRRLGGYTGDVLGAAAETSEVVALVALAVMLR